MRITIISLLSIFFTINEINGENPGHDWFKIPDTTVLMPKNWDIPEKHHPPLQIIVPDVPSLHDQRITVKYAHIGTTMNARPTVWSLIFRNRDNRHYIIRVNKNEEFEGVQYNPDIPMESRIGLWIHELMHIKDYNDRGFFGVLERGWQYLSKRGRAKFEYEIDMMVIEAGYRYYLYRWAYYVLYDSDASDEYKQYKRDIYLTPEEILGEMDELGYVHIPLFFF
ncbi:hypothetical protein [Alkalitalea saponilacus]|uniref:Uncharacterized protein n=1 Tax=Alkalitalea saponilacus TaxID=889453 RepID=A0A1T5HTW2_9BACT|nr:hypothetical protein [Alkalitalea saponilacus]ASB50245.1 hypothetical protein CDL62_14410 [Alkalitalea saponilacus]SKC24106.1 hypothetical protein SAMN03080601_03399 [Alkalitalea saponilacus]